jgi:predicted nucleic acid-binding protein
MGMSRVFWDSNLFIYLFEKHPVFSAGVKSLLNRMEVRGDQLFTSALSVGEVLAKPYELGDLVRCAQYEKAMEQTAVILPFDLPAARQFAKLRAQRTLRVRPPDVMQLACAATAGVDLFLTNDVRLHSMHVDGIQFITSVERAPL